MVKYGKQKEGGAENMENISLAIVSDDRDYGRSLGFALLSVYEGFSVRVMGKEDYRVLADSENFGLVLWDGQEEEPHTLNTVYLDERSGSGGENTGKAFKLWRYAPARDTVPDILKIYGEITGKKDAATGRLETGLVCFSAWSGGVGCTALAAAVGRELSLVCGLKALYISFEPVESTAALMKYEGGGRGIGRYLYELSKKGKAPPPEEYIIRDDFGMEAFIPSEGLNPVRYLNREETEIFLSAAQEAGHYDIIVADMGTCLSEACLWLMERAGKICFVSAEGRRSPKEKGYIKNLRLSRGEDIEKKAVFVLNMAEKGGQEEGFLRVRKKEGADWRGPSEGGFGEDVARLTRALLEF